MKKEWISKKSEDILNANSDSKLAKIRDADSSEFGRGPRELSGHLASQFCFFKRTTLGQCV